MQLKAEDELKRVFLDQNVTLNILENDQRACWQNEPELRPIEIAENSSKTAHENEASGSSINLLAKSADLALKETPQERKAIKEAHFFKFETPLDTYKILNLNDSKLDSDKRELYQPLVLEVRKSDFREMIKRFISM